MNRTKTTSDSRVLAAALLLAATLASAWGDGPGREFPAMALGVSPSRAEYWLGEPVVLNCRIVNWYSPYIRLFGAFGFRGRDSEVRLIWNNEERPPYWGPYDPAPTPPERFGLRYAKACEFRLTLLYAPEAPNGIALSPPGAYRCDVRQKMSMADLERGDLAPWAFMSQVLSLPFEIVNPPAEQQAALDILKAHPQMMREMQMRYASAANYERLLQIAAQYPKSRYAPWCLDAAANLALALAPARIAERNEARRLFERIAADYPDYPYRDDVRMTLADIYRRSGMLNRGIEIVRAIIDESEDNMFRFQKSDMMRPFIGPNPNPLRQENDSCWYLFPGGRLPEAWFQLYTQEVPR